MPLSEIGYVSPMAEGDTKGPPKPTPARFALAANLKELMDGYRLGFVTGINAPLLEKGCGVSAKSIRRMLDPYEEVSPGLDNIDTLSHFFGISTWELLKPRERQTAISGKAKQTPEKPAHSSAAAHQSKKHKERKSG